MKNGKIPKWIFYLNILALLFLIVLILRTYYELNIIIFEAFAELLTIPCILFVVFSLFYSVYNFFKSDRSKTVLITLLLSLISTLLVIFVFLK